ncbi:hypothetical protein M9H77_03594 [Catharanthus roseus]|uniref:Uncharacterized protein n=1 Tax=Catharanthus roseus TaxID=4058 RepID=A0ACC0CBS2_CATRO|nr:hypothetical protein M9H77_03594 [Catharanthus roseus]
MIKFANDFKEFRPHDIYGLMITFFPSHDASVWITNIFHERPNRSYGSWDKVLNAVKEIWWIEFMKYFCWNPEHHVKTRESFMKLASKRYRDMMRPQRIGMRDEVARVPLYRMLHTHRDEHEKVG